MTDIQNLVNAMCAAMKSERQKYHLTLGGLLLALENMPSPNATYIKFDDTGHSPCNPHSYRGYYEDLSFEESDERVTAAQFLAVAKQALGHTYTGWKGGDFTMHANTPLWRAIKGCCGEAIIAITPDGYLITKEV